MFQKSILDRIADSTVKEALKKRTYHCARIAIKIQTYYSAFDRLSGKTLVYFFYLTHSTDWLEAKLSLYDFFIYFLFLFSGI